MTIAERLRQEGHQIGWQEGKLEGTQLSEADLAANSH